MKKIKGLLAGLLAAITLFSVTGCSEDTSWIAKTEDETIPAGVYLSYLMTAYNEAVDQVDTTKDIWEQKIGDVSFEQWITDKANNALRQYVAINLLFDELGMTMGEEGKRIAENQTDSYWEGYEDMYEANGISYASLLKMAEADYKTQKVFEYYYDKGGVEEVPDKEIRDYFYDNYAKVKYLTVNNYNLETGKQYTESEFKGVMDAYVTRINKGTDIDVIIDEYTAAIYKAYGFEEYKPDTSDSSRNVALLYKEQEGYLAHLAEMTFEQKEFNVPYVDDTSKDGSWYLCARYDLTKDEELYETNRDDILYQMRGSDYIEKLEERIASVDIELNVAAINRYSPRNIKVS